MRIRGILSLAIMAAVLAGCGVLGGPSLAPAVSTAWSTVGPAPVALTEVAVAAHLGRIWVAGGLLADGTASAAVLVFDPKAGTWATGPRLPATIHHSALVSTPGGLVLVGGYVGDTMTVATGAVWRLDDGGAQWTEGVALPEARAAGGAAFDGVRIVYAGGVKPGGIANEVFALGTGDATWTAIGLLPTAREHLAVTSDGLGLTFVLGGRVGALDHNLSTVDVVKGTGEGAVRTIGDLPTKRGGAAAFWLPALGACLAGGESPGGTNPQVECMTADGTLARLPDLGVARHGLGAAVVKGSVYTVLGGRQPGLSASDVTETLALP